LEIYRQLNIQLILFCLLAKDRYFNRANIKKIPLKIVMWGRWRPLKLPRLRKRAAEAREVAIARVAGGEITCIPKNTSALFRLLCGGDPTSDAHPILSWWKNPFQERWGDKDDKI
jgi:hypothetical protein